MNGSVLAWALPITLTMLALSMLGMYVMLTLSIYYDSSAYFEAALLIALLGFVSTTAMAKFLLRGEVIE